MLPLSPNSTRTSNLFPYTTRFRSPLPVIPTSSRATILRPTRSRNARGRCDPFPLLRWGRGPDRGNEGKRRTPHRPLPPFCPAGEREICPTPKQLKALPSACCAWASRCALSDRKCVEKGKRVTVRVDLGCGRRIQQKHN